MIGWCILTNTHIHIHTPVHFKVNSKLPICKQKCKSYLHITDQVCQPDCHKQDKQDLENIFVAVYSLDIVIDVVDRDLYSCFDQNRTH